MTLRPDAGQSQLRILLAEDDDDVRLTTRLVLEKQGFSVVAAPDGLAAWNTFSTSEEPFDAAVLDVMMPGMDGISLTKKIREVSALPVILLTARDLPMDQVMGLEAGSDDYVTKPFNSDVLAARIRAAVRRARTASDAPDDADIVHLGDLAVDVPGMTIQRHGELLDITATEFRILATLLEHAGQVLSRSQLLDRVWGSTYGYEERIVDVNIQRLRTKIGADVIVTVRGAGYKVQRPS